ncbi:M81 family metallopeptidase [Chloroflexi bacterium TSY]|nr:M81 family metallopeptidase [Chloroflexi bacterium TSY]
MSYRIAIGSIFTECNELGGLPIDLDWFERYEYLRGEEILQIKTGVVGGMLQVLHRHNCQPVSLLWASTCPGGPLTDLCYQQLKEQLIDSLRDALPVDAVLLPLHGAAVTESVGDLEGDLIRSVRNVLEEETAAKVKAEKSLSLSPASSSASIPIVVTLDLHAHVTPDMVQYADALVAWETYPHADAYTTGQRGAQLLINLLRKRCHATMAAAKVPVITSAIRGSTHGDDPFARLMRQAKALEKRPEVLSTSLSRSKFGVFGYFQSRLQGFWSHLFRFRLQKTTYFISENRPNLTQKLDIDRQICIYVNCLARILSQNLKFGSTEYDFGAPKPRPAEYG